MPGIVRRAIEADRERISEIRFSVKENVLRDRSRVTHDMITWFMTNPGIWLWEEDGKVLGFSAADTRDGTIFALFIDPAHEGRGIGRALFAKALDSLREAGHREGSLTTQPGSRADRFYQKAGWKVIGTSERGERIFLGVL
ncbi:MAG: GNAT family N-acetyltransferase [Reyranella sp.]|uniref:GNAT family N-acetyltransferase n=1 Tax=Reyranella sp. TaxID=1929291 RepID=UPI001ACC9B32|nr:GNAT family N-acetyltransferase [Reyranella sp.]MBN9089828.1 GNAT family N-acetyltransferase [Reyranella sp.]